MKKLCLVVVSFLVVILAMTWGYMYCQDHNCGISLSEQSKPQAFVPRTEFRKIHSSLIGQDFDIFIAFPMSYGTKKEYPTLYLMDANLGFGMATQIYQLLEVGGFPEIVIVGVGFPTYDIDEYLALRQQHFTPPGNFEITTSGSADIFLDFLGNELIPLIESEYLVLPNDRAMMGASHSGLFALYALFQSPRLFNHYIIGSPAVYRDDYLILKYEEDFAIRHNDLDATVFLSVGADEHAQFVPDFNALVSTLEARGYPSLDLKHIVFEGETHFSAPAQTLSRGLREIFGALDAE